MTAPAAATGAAAADGAEEPSRRTILVGALAGAVASAVVLGVLIRPIRVGPVGFDSAASVLHFDRIVSGTRLEAFVTTTPKPLLTVVYGLAHALVPDWRVISLAVIAAAALAVLLAVLLVARAVPGTPWLMPVVVVPLVLLGSPSLVQDVGSAYAVPWALIGWLVAGLAALGPRPRPWLMGLALMLATLARLETAVISGFLALALVVQVARAATGRPAGSWSVRSLAGATALAALALPVMLVHDWLLTGNPMFWVTVSASFSSATASIPTPRDVLDAIGDVIWARPVQSVVAVAGLVALWTGRRRALLVGILALGPGMSAFLVVLAARATYVSPRYYAAIELDLAVLSAIGAAAVARELADRTAAWRSSKNAPATGLVAIAGGLVVAATVLGAPFAPLDRGVISTLHNQTALARLGDRAEPSIAAQLAGSGLAGGQQRPADSLPWLYLPALLRPRLAVDLNLPLWAVTSVNTTILDPATKLRPGAAILHSRRFDPPQGGYATLEAGGLVPVGSHRAQTIATPDTGTWVLVVR